MGVIASIFVPKVLEGNKRSCASSDSIIRSLKCVRPALDVTADKSSAKAENQEGA